MELIRTPKVENVRMLEKFGSFGNWGGRLSNRTTGPGGGGPLGTLYLTATHLIFVDHEGKKETWILHSLLSTMEKLSISTNGTPLHIRCKNYHSVTFVIPKERDAHDIYSSLFALSQPLNSDDLYCFQYAASNEDFQMDRSLGWDKFDLLQEYERFNVPDSNWVLTTINKNFEICDTYPRYLFVPALASTQMLLGSSKFRSRGGLPVLSYLYKNGAAVCRCSQPLSGFSARCLEDEQLLNCILKANSSSNVLYVVDTRPRINAMANKAAGKGYESENFYENIKFHFFGIENIHVMRGSLQKLMDACELKIPSVNAFLSALESSGWLKHVKSVLETASFIAKAIEDGISVIIHCSDGWDRTAQTSSLTCLLLDPYYRTINGFEALIEKEWLAFGHKFNERCGHIQTGDPKEFAPVFSQFIDSVWQITQQFPFEFEFNEKFLINLHDHVYSCQFGTFLGNCEKERLDMKIKDRTYSLWAYLDGHINEFVNPLYVMKKKDPDFKPGVIYFNHTSQLIKFWRNMYNRFDVGVHPRESVDDLSIMCYNHIKSLEDHVKYLEEKIFTLCAKVNRRYSTCINECLTNKTVTPRSSSSTTGGETPNFRKSFGGDSFDSIDSPLRIVQECMNRLQHQHDMKEKEKLKIDDQDLNENENPSGKMSSLSLDAASTDSILAGNGNEINSLISDMESVALEWQSIRSAKECECGTPFEHSSLKYHCWSCGYIFCVRCIEKKIVLPGHSHKQKHVTTPDSSSDDDVFKANDGHKKSTENKPNRVPVCRKCFKNITNATSFELTS